MGLHKHAMACSFIIVNLCGMHVHLLNVRVIVAGDPQVSHTLPGDSADTAFGKTLQLYIIPSTVCHNKIMCMVYRSQIYYEAYCTHTCIM